MCVQLMLKSIQSTEGISLETEENNTGLPLEDLSEDEEEDIEAKDSQDTLASELEDIKGMTVQNEYVAEKECAVTALKDLAMVCGTSRNFWSRQGKPSSCIWKHCAGFTRT